MLQYITMYSNTEVTPAVHGSIDIHILSVAIATLFIIGKRKEYDEH